MHSSNHGELSASYFGSILAWEKTGRWLAAALASQANLSCSAGTGVLFPCHVAPWSYQSFDQSRYNLLCVVCRVDLLACIVSSSVSSCWLAGTERKVLLLCCAVHTAVPGSVLALQFLFNQSEITLIMMMMRLVPGSV